MTTGTGEDLLRVAILGTRFGAPTIEAAGLSDYRVDFTVDPGQDGQAIVAAAQEAAAVLAGGAPRFTRQVLHALPRLGAIVRYGVGVDAVDLSAATELGILVANVPDYATEEVSTHTVALILAAGRKLVQANDSVRQGTWAIAPVQPIFSLADQTVGIVGFGRIGQAVARKLAPFGPRLLVSDPLLGAVDGPVHGVAVVSLEQMLPQVDVLTLNAPHTPATHHLLDGPALAQMKKTAIVVNTSRGGLIDEAALAGALERGELMGAALDVLEQEPVRPDDPLRQLPQVILTPHMAWYSVQAVARMRVQAVAELARMLRGERPRHLVNPDVLGGSRWSIR